MEVIDRCAGSPVSSLPLFRRMNSGQLQTAQSVLHRKVVPAGQILMTENDPGDLVYVIVSGAVRISIRRDMADVIVGLRGPGDLLGELSILDGATRSATAITQTPCTLLWASHDDFWDVLWEIKPFAMNLTCHLSQRVRTLTAQVEAMASLSVQGRLARQVMALAEEYGCPTSLPSAHHAIEIPFHLTQADLASMIGATRVQVNQVFCQWKRRGFIEMRNGHVVVRDGNAVQALMI